MKNTIVPMFVFFLSFASAVFAADVTDEEPSNFEYQTVTTKEGLTFRVPEDMPVETRGGIVAPIPFDEYVFGKFKQMDQKLKAIDTKLDRIEKLLSNESVEAPAKPAGSSGVLRSLPRANREEEGSDV